MFDILCLIGRIWMPLVALPGSLNDLNIADRSRVMHQFVTGPLSSVSYKLNGNEYKMAYNLADGMLLLYVLLSSIAMLTVDGQ